MRGHQVAHHVELCPPHRGETGVRRGGEVTSGELGHLREEGPAERVVLQRAVPAGAPGTRNPAAVEEGNSPGVLDRHDAVMDLIPADGRAVGRSVGPAQLQAELSLADERALRRGDVATLVPPHDVHNHGHVTGTGPSPYSLILLGDNMLVFERKEYDPERGTWRRLAPGDAGRSNR